MEDLRNKVIRLAHEMPELRRHLVPLLRLAKVFPTEDALDKYLKDHPGADKSKHTLKRDFAEKGKQIDEEETSKSKALPEALKKGLKRFPNKPSVKMIKKVLDSKGPPTPEQIRGIAEALDKDIHDVFVSGEDNEELVRLEENWRSMIRSRK